MFDVIKNFRLSIFFFFNDTATTEIYTLSLHDALPISEFSEPNGYFRSDNFVSNETTFQYVIKERSEEHTSELQSQSNLVCRLLLEKKRVMPGPDSSSARRPDE